MIAFQVTRWFSDAFRESHTDVVDRANALFLKNDVPSYAATCRMLGAFDGRADLAKINVPTEVIVGEHDYATPPDMARQLEGAIAGAHLTIVPEARHLTMLEIPDEVTTVIRATVARSKDAAIANRR
jgi:3-oxoadipate enol-lactonase